MVEQKVGGDFGDIRNDISVDALNVYLAANVPELHVPVVVKQFQVCITHVLALTSLLKGIE
jgi:hypothetical protein